MKWDVLVPVYVKNGKAWSDVENKMIEVYKVEWMDRGTVSAPTPEEALQRAKLQPGVLFAPAVQPSKKVFQ